MLQLLTHCGSNSLFGGSPFRITAPVIGRRVEIFLCFLRYLMLVRWQRPTPTQIPYPFPVGDFFSPCVTSLVDRASSSNRRVTVTELSVSIGTTPQRHIPVCCSVVPAATADPAAKFRHSPRHSCGVPRTTEGAGQEHAVQGTGSGGQGGEGRDAARHVNMSLRRLAVSCTVHLRWSVPPAAVLNSETFLHPSTSSHHLFLTLSVILSLLIYALFVISSVPFWPPIPLSISDVSHSGP
jgi:hypothetical protein